MSEQKYKVHSFWLWLAAAILAGMTIWCTRGAVSLSGYLEKTEYGLAMPHWAGRQFLGWCVGAAVSGFVMVVVLFQLLIRRLQRPPRKMKQTRSKRAGG